MDIDLLKTFLEVNRTRHFGKAADYLCVTQSTVSARIRQLEDAVGVPVFTRARNDIQLTPAGQKLVRYAESMITTWNRVRQEIAVPEESKTSLSVAGVASLWDIFLQQWLHKVRNTVPDLMLNVDVASAEIISRRLLDNTLELGFMFEVPQIAELEAVEISRESLIMVSSDAAQSPEQALAVAYVLVDWGTSFSMAHARYFPEAPPPVLRTGLGRMARDFILDCGGSAYLAEAMVAEDLKKGRLHPVADAPVIERSIHAVFQVASNKQAILRQLISLAQQLVAARET